MKGTPVNIQRIMVRPIKKDPRNAENRGEIHSWDPPKITARLVTEEVEYPPDIPDLTDEERARFARGEAIWRQDSVEGAVRWRSWQRVPKIRADMMKRLEPPPKPE